MPNFQPKIVKNHTKKYIQTFLAINIKFRLYLSISGLWPPRFETPLSKSSISNLLYTECNSNKKVAFFNLCSFAFSFVKHDIFSQKSYNVWNSKARSEYITTASLHTQSNKKKRKQRVKESVHTPVCRIANNKRSSLFFLPCLLFLFRERPEPNLTLRDSFYCTSYPKQKPNLKLWKNFFLLTSSANSKSPSNFLFPCCCCCLAWVLASAQQ